MRKCPYCGREYADDAALCVVDESPLIGQGEAITCEFGDAAEMSNAIRWLGVLLNSTLRVNVEWNKEKQRFQKKSHCYG